MNIKSQRKTKKLSNEKGAVALIVVVVIAAASLLMAYNASFLGLGDLELGYSSQKGGEALAVSEGCLEEALRRIRLDENYGVGQGEMNLSLDNGSCIIEVGANGNDRDIITTGNIDNYNKIIEANLTLSGDNNDVININSWEEK